MYTFPKFLREPFHFHSLCCSDHVCLWSRPRVRFHLPIRTSKGGHIQAESAKCSQGIQTKTHKCVSHWLLVPDNMCFRGHLSWGRKIAAALERDYGATCIIFGTNTQLVCLMYSVLPMDRRCATSVQPPFHTSVDRIMSPGKSKTHISLFFLKKLF